MSDPLDSILNASAPGAAIDISPRHRRLVVRATRREARRRMPRAAKALLGAGLSIALIGGGAAAAFADPGLRDWFFGGIQDPYVTIQYTVPSGAVCTETSGDPLTTDSEAAEALRSWLASADLLALIDVDAALGQVRAYDEYDRSQLGSDEEYRMAVGIAVVLAAREELASRGFPHGSIDQWKTEGSCTEPDLE